MLKCQHYNLEIFLEKLRNQWDRTEKVCFTVGCPRRGPIRRAHGRPSRPPDEPWFCRLIFQNSHISAEKGVSFRVSQKVRVRLKWLERKNPGSYINGIPVRFVDEGENWKYRDMWGLVIMIEGQPNSNREQNGTAWYFSEKAPHEDLKAGRSFFVLEGAHETAMGVIKEVLSK